jgi:hypothetical protein
MERLAQSVFELHEKRGPMYRRWHTRLTEALANTHLDDTPARP